MSDLKTEYRFVDDDDALIKSLQHRANDVDGAWTRYTLEGDAESVRVRFETNDDRDHGVPTEDASDEYVVHPRGGESALARALAVTGVCRHGVGHAVLVTVNGRYVI